MKRAHWLILGSVLFLIGCASESGVLKSGFDVRDMAWAQGQGTNTIRGEAVLTSKKETHNCSVYTAVATPDSAHARERLQILYGSTERGVRSANTPGVCLAPDYPAYRQLQRTADCDEQGRFLFNDLPDGVWYIAVPVIWQSKLGQPFEGGTFMKRVAVSGGTRTDITLGY